MNLDSLSYTLSQITYLVVNLSKKNYKQSVQEIQNVIQLQGFEADRHFLRCLLSHIDLNEGPRNTSHKNYFQAQLLAQQCTTLLNKPSLTSTLCFALDNPLNILKEPIPSLQKFIQLSRILHLSPVQEVVFGLVCLESKNYGTYALQFLKQKLPLLIKAYIDSNFNCIQVTDGGLNQSSPEILHLILSYVFNENNQSFEISKEDKKVLLFNLRRDFPLEVVPILLAPIIYSNKFDQSIDKINSDIHVNIMENLPLSDIVKEMGYSFCSSLDECRKNLLSVTSGCVASVTFGPKSVAKVISMMIRTHTGLDSQLPLPYWSRKNANHNINKSLKSKNFITWNMEIFINTIKKLNPSLSWIELIKELDHEEFFIKDRQGLVLLFLAIKLGLNVQGYYIQNFPINMIYRHWTYSEAQMSLIQQMLQNSDIFCFADYPYSSVSIKSLKVIPEISNRDISNWQSIQLVDLLIHLAECGLRNDVLECLKFPVKKCPDILALALIESDGSFNRIRHEIISSMIPIFLENYCNALIIFRHAWNHQNVSFKHTIIQAMYDWYMINKQDQIKLSRILDISIDLKGLPLVLNFQQYPFIIDLACLASQRDYIKLEKWLSDKIFEHKETFVLACIDFLQTRCPQLSGLTKNENSLKYTPLSSETILIMLNCLQNVTISLHRELLENIFQMVSIYTNICKPKGAHVIPPIVHTTQNHKPIASVHQGMVDQLIGVPINFDKLGIDPVQTSFSSVQTPGSSQNILDNNLNGLGNLSIMTSSLNNISDQTESSISNMMLCLPSEQVLPSIIETINNSNFNFLFNNNMPVTISKEAEDEANNYFQCIYNLTSEDSLTIDNVLEMLKRFKESSVKLEKDIHYCMIRNLFEEYKFFTSYPKKELIITGHLFGGIVQYNLLSNYKAVVIVLHIVLDALRKSPNSNMFDFGITALDRFKHVLREYHQLCALIHEIPHFQQFPQILILYVEYGKLSLPPPYSLISDVVASSNNTILPGTGVPNLPNALISQHNVNSLTTNSVSSKVITTNALLSSRPSLVNITNIDILLVATDNKNILVIPPENVRNRISFIFNNLSIVNIVTKCEEIKEIIVNGDYLPWTSQYMVMKRVSIETNFHTLYSTFLDYLRNEKLNALIIKECYRNIRILLRSDKVMDNFSHKSLLKNLGHWLGMMTLAKNKPLLLKDINLKNLLVESYNKGQRELLFIVPFITRILKSCAKSKVFKPRNPWTMSILNCLAEIHQVDDLKLTLKFEVEVLCNTLKINIHDLKPGDILQKTEISDHLRQLSNEEDFKSEIQTKIKNIPDQPSLSVSRLQQENPILEKITSFQTQQNIISTVQPTNFNIHVNDDLVASVVAAGGITPLATGYMGISGKFDTPYLPILKPKFNYMVFNTANSVELLSMVAINSQIPLFLNQPVFETYVQASIEQSIQDLQKSIVNKHANIAAITTENIIKKDFGMNSDESHMRKAAHCMVRNLTSGLTMITCREQVLQVLTTNLNTTFHSVLTTPTQSQIEMIDQASQICANDNLELACAILQNIASEKAVIEIDNYLKSEYENRNLSRTANIHYYDTEVLNSQVKFLPDTLQTKNGLPLLQINGIYEDYARNIPGFQVLDRESISKFFPKCDNPIDEMTVMYEKLMNEIEELIQVYMNNQIYLTNTTQASNLHSVLEAMTQLRKSRNIVTGTNIIYKVIESYLEGLSPLANQNITMTIKFRDMHLNIIRAFQDPRAYNLQWTNNTLTKAVVECRDEIRFNIEAIDILICAGMLNIGIYDVHLAMSMDNGLNYESIVYIKQFLQYYFIDNRLNSPINDYHIKITLGALSVIVLSGHSIPDGLTSILEVIKPPQTDYNFVSLIAGVNCSSTDNAHTLKNLLQGRDKDHPGFFEKTEYLLKEWMKIYESGSYSDSDKAFNSYILQMNVQGILQSDDNINLFFRLCIQLILELYYTLMPDKTLSPTIIRAKVLHIIDGFVRLVVFLIKHSGGDTDNAVNTKTSLLNKVLGIVVGVMLQDHTVQSTSFHQLIYHRIFISLLHDLNAPDPVLQSIPILKSFCQTFHLIRPKRLPGFTYVWLELISHRLFIDRILVLSQQKQSNNPAQTSEAQYYAELLTDLFEFFAPFLRNAELSKSINLLYKGTLRVLLILLHDFPEFLCEYHYRLCEVIPPNCIQLRNVILSAFPRHMRLPDPFMSNLKIDMLQEISQNPKILSEYLPSIQPLNFKKDLDLYLKARSPVTFLTEIRTTLQQTCNEPGMRYNISLLNAMVLYVGTQAIQQIRNEGLVLNILTITHSSHMDIFQHLSVDLDTEGRYLFLSAIANQLRYPNSHTLYFSCAILYLFAEANRDIIREQIARVLLERIIVNKPHPWGLLITFIELIKNPVYKFWDYEFVTCAPEIEKLFMSVARSCMVNKQTTTAIGNAGNADLPSI